MENNTRPTIEITLPIVQGGKKIKAILYEYAIGADMRLIQNAMMKFATINGTEAGIDLSNGDYSELENTLINRLVVSVDGVSDNLIKSIEDLRIENYQYIIAELNKLTSPEEIKKN